MRIRILSVIVASMLAAVAAFDLVGPEYASAKTINCPPADPEVPTTQWYSEGDCDYRFVIEDTTEVCGLGFKVKVTIYVICPSGSGNEAHEVCSTSDDELDTCIGSTNFYGKPKANQNWGSVIGAGDCNKMSHGSHGNC